MLAVARSPNFKDVENFGPRHDSSLGYVRESKKTLISMLGVSEDIIVNTPRSKCLDASEKYYMNSVQDEDAFFAFVSSCSDNLTLNLLNRYYVVLLPCVLVGHASIPYRGSLFLPILLSRTGRSRNV